MSVSSIPDIVKFKLWALAAGRCQYCNKPLWEDLMTKSQMNTAYIAHIYAEKPNGPRYHPALSEQLKQDFSNLMLLCDVHHRMIDNDVEAHPAEKLIEMKRRHEDRVILQTDLDVDQQSHILHYIATVSGQIPVITWQQSKAAMFPYHYPAEAQAIEISLKNSLFVDAEQSYWEIERENLRRQYRDKIWGRLGSDIRHLSVFALAPQPLLIELGRLLSDISGISIYQHQKEPHDSWMWSDTAENFEYLVQPAYCQGSKIALNLSLSVEINDSRITAILGEDVAIWKLTSVSTPHNDFLKGRAQLQAFREAFRYLLNKIKQTHGENQIIHLFPAAPVAIAVEIGRVWSHKADLPLRIYDQNSRLGGFVQTIDIHNY